MEAKHDGGKCDTWYCPEISEFDDSATYLLTRFKILDRFPSTLPPPPPNRKNGSRLENGEKKRKNTKKKILRENRSEDM